MHTVIRKATREDIPQILAFIHALADYEHLAHAVTLSADDLERDGFGPHPYFQCLMAEYHGQPAGYALYFFNYSTFVGRPGIYLEDLFVLPEFRGKGIGKALLCQLAAVALENHCGRFEWSVLDWNQPSIDFYRSQGGEILKEWRIVRVTGEALSKLAHQAARQGAGEQQ